MTYDPAKFIGDIPANYDRGLGPVLFADYAADLARRAAALKPLRVLELAAGTGIVTRKLRDALAEGAELVATDLNPPMIEIARAKFDNGENIEFADADAMALNYADNSFDLIVCQFGVMFFPDKAAAFREARRVLKPGGAYLFNVWSGNAENPFSQIACDCCAAFFPEDPPQFYRVPFAYGDRSKILKDLGSGGFSDSACEIAPRRARVEDWASFARGAVFGNALIDEIRARGGVDPEEFRKALEEAFGRAFGAAPTTMPIEAKIFLSRA
ncbi:MAG: class I SAM-dependent methyltransferase [Parvularculaceae bacterium]|nr:class I SAM-dependent methyltransferase [Parvularculaceae bacterium]